MISPFFAGECTERGRPVKEKMRRRNGRGNDALWVTAVRLAVTGSSMIGTAGREAGSGIDSYYEL